MTALGRIAAFAVVVAWCSGLTPICAQSATAEVSLSKDELAVYAAVIDQSQKLGKSSRPLIADMSSTFACGVGSCNGLSVGGCNGLRSAGESPSDRMTIVQRDLAKLEADTVSSFVSSNQKCTSIHSEISTAAGYYWYDSQGIPKDWKYSFLVYLSRAGFNHDHTQALLNVGLFSASSPADSEGKYLLLIKAADKWVISGSSAVWVLGTNH